ncbi:zinc finger HIT domain-containing protein 3 isoform X2 [Drosophila novamexicana]|uniref:zinc finger HIT domain-containing protein 3 isoform X2 n=1 Tax=Drosophila novamexicana TaxID=47314 RepID=UPI0011E5DAF2|nr:zinc finger HIT domain-containing protein 3 isoform X2 [Drosophila novamexicana]
MHHLALRILCRSTGWSKNSEPLRQLLHNPHLRALLQQIDVAYNANLAMTAAMQEPLFVEFANACLQVVEPMTEAERAERAELELCS